MFSSSASQVASAAENYIESCFSTWLYNGTGANQTITNNIDLSTKGGLVWTKSRGPVNRDHCLADTARGTNNLLFSNLTMAQDAASNTVTAFNSSGYSLGTDNLSYGVNITGDSYASWTFAKQPKFFDVVTYTGTGANRTIAHNLGSVPGCIIVKRTDTTGAWQVYHRSLANTQYMVLNTTAAVATGATRWNSTTPTDTVFSVGTDATVNASGGTYVAYLFAHDAGGFGLTGADNVISCGSYTGNGSTTGPVVTLGYEPQWLLLKHSSGSGAGWFLLDNMRGVTADGLDQRLFANESSAEGSDTRIAFNATGFQPRSGSPEVNQGGETYIYIAIRRGPMKVPTDGTKVFYPKVHSGSSSYPVGFPTDLCLAGDQSGNALNTVAVYRLAGNDKYFGGTASTAAEQTVSVCRFDLQNSFALSYNNNNQARWHFGRAPGFFDEVCFSSTSGSQTHNLGVTPELIIAKTRSVAFDWYTWHKDFAITDAIYLNSSAPKNNSDQFLSALPTSTTISMIYSSQPSVYYLFASCPGVSKVGSYTGNGTTQTINCGFTGGARFVLIKRTDSSGDWYVYDTARGMTVLTDPYLRLNSTAAEVATLGSVTTVSTGFALNSAILAAINVNGGSYIFLAIA